jgi:hypothetical protein
LKAPPANSEGWRNNRSDHGEGVLEAEDERQKDWVAFIQAVKRSLVIFVLPVERPDVWCE